MAGTRVAQVDVRIGETTLERYCVRAGEQLAVAGVIVTGDGNGFVVRRAIDDEAHLAPDEVITSRFELATVEVWLEVLPPMSLPRPPVDPWPAIYTMLSLVVHVCIWAVAMRVPLPAPRPHRVLARLVHHPHAPPPVPHAAPPPAPAPTKKSPEPHVRTAKEATARVTAALADVAKATKIDWDAAFSGVGEVHAPDEAPSFGHELATGGFRTIPSAPIAAIMSGNPLLYCVSDCRSNGPIDLKKLSEDLDSAWGALIKCDYTRGIAILTFTIDGDGHARVVETEGGGADCAARIIASNHFRAMGSPTDITLSLGYK